MRAVRFASRFGFNLEDSLVEAASDSKVRCCGTNTYLCFYLIIRSNFYQCPFLFPPVVSRRVATVLFGLYTEEDRPYASLHHR